MEPVNGNHEAPATETMDGPTAATQVDAMDTTTDGPPAEPQLSTQPESTAQPDANPPPPIPQPATATASPKSEPPVATESQPRPGVQTVREVLNTKINPFVSAGLRQIFRDPDNVPEDPLRILGEFLLEKHREIAAKGEAGTAKAADADS